MFLFQFNSLRETRRVCGVIWGWGEPPDLEDERLGIMLGVAGRCSLPRFSVYWTVGGEGLEVKGL